jgi:hypothetical protein
MARLAEKVPVPWMLGVAIVLGTLVMGIYGYDRWKMHVLSRQAREQATPACEEQLGADACRDHLERYHDDCLRLTRMRAFRGLRIPPSIDAGAYQRCVVLGVDEWVAENGRLHEEAERSRRDQYRPR